MTNYTRHKHNLHLFVAHYLTKCSHEISASSLKYVLNRGRKSAKNALIMHNYAN